MIRLSIMVLLGALLGCTESLWSVEHASAQDDFSPANTQWNGLSELLNIAEEQELSLEVVDRLDVGTLDENAALLIIGPLEEPSVEGVSALLRAGARIAVADDFGASTGLLRAFRIERRAPSPHRTSALRGNEALLIARPFGPHALSVRVDALVSNHPQAIQHADLEPIFAFSDNEALVLAGAVGTGRLVVISDPSVFINNMLELGGNRRFAGNLLRYLAAVGPGDDTPPRRILLVPPGAPVVGRFGEPGADRPLHDLRSFLERLRQVEVPGVGLRVLALCLILIFMLVVGGALPRKSPYAAGAMFTPSVTFGGMAGRLAWYGRGNVDLLDPLLAYRFELETELYRRADVERSAGTAALKSALIGKGVAARDAAQAQSLLDELSEVAERADRGTVEPVGLPRLKDAMRRGDAILGMLSSSHPSNPPPESRRGRA